MYLCAKFQHLNRATRKAYLQYEFSIISHSDKKFKACPSSLVSDAPDELCDVTIAESNDNNLKS